MEPSYRKLYRSLDDRVLAGVCGGFGEYFNIDPVILRLVWVGLTFINGSGIILYLIGWLIIPRRPGNFN